MVIYIGADHRGFNHKKAIVEALKYNGYPVVDVGDGVYNEQDDYVDFGVRVAERVSVDYEHNRGVLICGSGAGMCIVANKYMNVRAVLASSSDQAYDSKTDDDTNVLCLGADYMDAEQAKKIVLAWLQAPFSDEERHRRRIEKIAQIELKYIKPVHGDE